MASGSDVAARAKAEMAEIGGTCSNNNKYTHWYSDNVDNIGYNFWWCAAFVSYVLRACDVPTSVAPNFVYCPDLISWARNNDRLYTKSQVTSGAYIPQPGDIFLRDGHTGIIVSVNDGQFTTVEGNTGGTTNCRTVGSHTWTFSSGNYDYVFNPDYPDTAVPSTSERGNILPKFENIAPIEPTDALAVYASDVNITKYIGSISWKNSIYELATMLSFETAKTDNAYLKDLIYTPKLGEVIRIVTNGEVFRGIVTKVDDGDKNKNKYTAVDLGWYLNKTSQTYQFTDITVKDAIKEICEDLAIPIDNVCELSTVITQIYFDKTVSDIIKDLLSNCGNDYNYDFTPNGLRIYKVGDLVAYPEFRLASNLVQGYSVDYRGNVSHSESIEDMKNSIKIVSEKDNVYTEIMTLKNNELIEEYGLLQYVIKIDPEKDNAEVVANSELWWNARTKETYSFEIIEKYDSYTRAGEVIMIDDVYFIIESTNHTLSNGWHFNKLELTKL